MCPPVSRQEERGGNQTWKAKHEVATAEPRTIAFSIFDLFRTPSRSRLETRNVFRLFASKNPEFAFKRSQDFIIHRRCFCGEQEISLQEECYPRSRRIGIRRTGRTNSRRSKRPNHPFPSPSPALPSWEEHRSFSCAWLGTSLFRCSIPTPRSRHKQA